MTDRGDGVMRGVGLKEAALASFDVDHELVAGEAIVDFAIATGSPGWLAYPELFRIGSVGRACFDLGRRYELVATARRIMRARTAIHRPAVSLGGGA